MRRDKRYHNKKWLKKKYIDQDKSSYEIAEICDVSQTTISAWLGKHNIKTKNIGRPSQRIEKACKSCGKTFQVKPSRKNEEYCSQQCAVEDRKAEIVEVECEYCGSTFKIPDYDLGGRRFCSRKCAAKSHGEQMRIWDSKEAYNKSKREAPGNLEENKKRARERDNHTCQFCGKTEKSGDYDYYKLATHHINPIRKGGTNHIGNIITLCHSCHNSLERYVLEKRIKQEV